jgi:hypothetical protein
MEICPEMKALLPYLLWVPLTIFYNWLLCVASVHFGGKDFLKTYGIMCLISMIPTWSIASYFSRNLVFDALIFDSSLVLSSPLILWSLGQGKNFPPAAWIGVCLTVAGLIVIRVSTNH